MASDVRFPVLRSVEVRNYPMYPFPGLPDAPGFGAPILPGVTVVVGINGIGKTTLLNLLLWMLTGPRQPTKADLMRPGSGRHRRTNITNFQYFAARVGAPIPAAEATVVVSFGTETLRITRSLASLKLKSLWHNEAHLAHADEERYLDLVQELSGTNSEWDFDFVVRHLVFFLEEKAPLLWSEEGQFELLRILFLETALSGKCVVLSDEIAKLDSQIRNTTWQLSDTREALGELEEAAAEGGSAEDTLPIVEARLTAVREALVSLERREEEERSELDDLEKRAFETDQRLDEKRLELRQVEQQYFRESFPDLPVTTELTFGRLLAGDACLVCGSDPHRARERLRNLQANHACPVCETPDVGRKGKGSPASSLSKARLAKIEKEVAGLSDERDGTMGLLDQSRQRFADLKAEQRANWIERARLESLAADLQAQTQPIDERSLALRQRYEEADRLLTEKRNIVALKRKQYSALLAKAKDRIADVAAQVSKVFSGFADRFLEEDCRLEYTMHRRRIGESGAMLEFPSFVLQMGSATSKTLRTRDSASAVSESQKEFLDLAFRMAVMRTALDPTSATMLVIETPESSLDSYFVERAGQMLRNFTREGKAIRHTVIASSNLNRESMIPALLGLSEDSTQPTPAAEIDKRVINLLDIAAKPKALVQHLEHYEARLAAALKIPTKPPTKLPVKRKVPSRAR